MTKGDTVDDRSFDNLVRDLAASVQSRRTVALTAVGLGLSLISSLAGADAAPRRQGKRRKNGKPGKGKKPNGSHPGDCDTPETCPRDPETGKPGFLCPDGLCSCGGTCCEKGYACFVEKTTPGREVCCYIDSNQIPPPGDAKLISCPGERFDPESCCERDLCLSDGTCAGLTLGRYRRNPR